VRAGGPPPRLIACRDVGDVVPAVVEHVVGTDEERSVGVVAPEPLLDAIATALRDAAAGFVDGRRAVELGDGVALVPPEMVKGLEFDAVVVAEPAAIARAGEHGLRLLFIALTRAVRTLTVVHAEPLPAALADATR
jgi:superfamily I DNA/RNA helicase